MKLALKSIWMSFWGRFENRLLVYYLTAGGLWILLSDRALMLVASSPLQLTRWQTFKGWLYVLVSGLFIWLIVRIYNHRLKQKMNELSQALQKAEESDRLKTIFLQNVSHEVRTPLNGIMGFSEILESSAMLSDEEQTYLRHIRKNSEELKAFMDKVLDVAIIDSGSARLVPRKVALSELTREIYFEGQHLSSLHPHLDFNFEDLTSSHHSTLIETDPMLIMRIISNILENAFRFTKSGQIGLKIYIEGDELVMEVSDTGPGISDKEIVYIFDRFRTGEDLPDTVTRGAGLGLYISSRYAAMLGGKLLCFSTPGEGSVFKLEIPFQLCT